MRECDGSRRSRRSRREGKKQRTGRQLLDQIEEGSMQPHWGDTADLLDHVLYHCSASTKCNTKCQYRR